MKWVVEESCPENTTERVETDRHSCLSEESWMVQHDQDRHQREGPGTRHLYGADRPSLRPVTVRRVARGAGDLRHRLDLRQEVISDLLENGSSNSV